MVGKGDGVAEVGYGFQAGRVEDVVDAEGGEFADVGVADARPHSMKASFSPFLISR